MTHTHISSHWDLGKFDDYLKQIEGPLDFRTTNELEKVLKAAFAASQAKTHIISGSLKASGKTESDYDGDQWTGDIEYGGALLGAPTPGPPRDPVEYAVYEAARGEEHDPLAGLESFDEAFESAIDKFFDRR